MTTVEEFLEHHGVKGMKWGVRKDPGHEGERIKTKKLAKLDKQWEKKAGHGQTWVNLHNRAADLANAHDIERINNKAQYKGQDFSKDSPLRKQYYNEHQQAYIARVNQAAKEIGTNPSGTRQLSIHTDPTTKQWNVSVAAVKHDAFANAMDNFHGKKIKIKHHPKTGHIVYVGAILNANGSEADEAPDADDAPPSGGSSAGASAGASAGGAAAQGESFVGDFLTHYGVKGMKWGVRRETSGGSSRGSVSTKAKAKVNETKAAIKKDIAERQSTETTVRAKPGKMVQVVGGTKRGPHADAVKARVAEQVAKKNTLDALSNQDLQHLVTRMNLESQYRQLASKETRQSAGEKAVAGILKDPKIDVVLGKALGPQAAVGKKVVNLAFKQATQNKAMLGGKVKEDKKNN